EQAVLEAKKRLEDNIANPSADFEYAEAAAELAETIAQLRLIQKLRK
ncbi:MAG: ATP synthase delta/epsilon chain alpha-helix domain-containing protein, partial [Paraglaciecola polaris]